jgi:hypothetical protein
MTSTLPLADSIVNPFSGLDIPVAWILACLILALLAVYLWFARHNAYNHHAARNYLAASIGAGVLSLAALAVVLNDIFSALGAATGVGGGTLALLALAMFVAHGGARR